MSMFAKSAERAAPATAPSTSLPVWALTEPVKALCRLSPRWAEIRGKMIELAQRHEALFRELQPLRESLARQGEFNSVAMNDAAMRAAWHREHPAKAIEASPAAAKLLGPLTPAPRAAVLPFRGRVKPERERFDEIAEEITAIDEALALLSAPMTGKRLSEVETLYFEACKKYCEIVAPEFDAIVARFCTAAVDLGKAKTEYENFVREKLRGVAWVSLRPIDPLPMLGDPAEPTSALRLMLAHAEVQGHFSPADLPENWKQPAASGARKPRSKQ
jgi:hypothetical protein